MENMEALFLVETTVSLARYPKGKARWFKMRIEKVDGNKIKVTVTSADLMCLDISMEHLTPDSPKLHNFLFHVMENIKEETGFNPYNGQVVVEAMPASDGIILMVSKIKEQRASKAPVKKRKIKAVHKKSGRQKVTYYFDQFEDLCKALEQAEEAVLQRSTLYEMEGGFYLVVSRQDKTCRTHFLFLEFCDEIDEFEMMGTFLEEHGVRIAARKDVCSMADGLRSLNNL